MAPALAHREQLERARRRLEVELGRAEGLGASDPIVLPAWAAVVLAQHLRQQQATPRPRKRQGLALLA